MVTLSEARTKALALPEVEEKSHFERPDFRIRKRIFAVLHENKNAMVIKLSAIDQDVFCSFDKEIIHPVSGGWGKQGWTHINLKKIKKSMFTDALTTAWKTVAGTKLTDKYFRK
ncbi:MAG: MmcQ/YjbR family DNA-binding protein [Chitinophagaceae bacterium]|nr:MmcQ/YjbR family DNA-binding protein [Chitinophagaceae bacterium]